ncbi:sensor histidine kinase [Pseudoalteromonas sp. A3]|uniref:sensor histidine kinase n=1 Tax=Pseudoalteromonas sp. A3 TaxID=142792 RepID=UPI00221E57DE|nr:sensor histidine kinase [Pseudoalteromonas sp. A3]MCW1717791.1 sensor histidine kinase [Pseudoalteromonas sp. A3]
MQQANTPIWQRFSITQLIIYLPLMAAILLESHIRFLSSNMESIGQYLTINTQLFLQCIPLFIAHAFAYRLLLTPAIIAWLLGFLAYPFLLLILNIQLFNFAQWQFINEQCWAMCASASGIWLITRRTNRNHNVLSKKWLKSLLSLDSVVFIVLLGWAIITASILNTHINPMLNQPIKPIINVRKVFTQFDVFLGYLWQITFSVGLIYGVYLINRYLLIRYVLTYHGVLMFLFANLISLAVLTPVLISCVLLLPINDLPVGIANLTPGGNNNIFSPENYQFVFLFLAISTPIILAFERQQQHVQISNIAQQQTKIELKLLQQQINPHFLFNTLNNLYALTLKKADNAPDLVMELANLLRYSVYEGQKTQVSLEKEINYLKGFIALHNIRNTDRCHFDVQWPEYQQHYLISPLLLIMILENAIKHGVEPTSQKVTVVFKITMANNILTLFSSNPILTNNNLEHGVGLNNLRRRLTLLYPNKHTLIIDKNNTLWQTTLKLELTAC